MKFGTTNIKNVKFGLVNIQKVYFGLIKIWENWTYVIGNLVTMTSNSLPSPYVASLITGVTSGSAYQVFDNSNTTKITANYFSPSTLGLGAKLLFGQSIRIAKMIVRGSRSGQAQWMCTVYGIKEDNTKTLIHQAYINVNSDITITSNDQVTSFKGIEIYCDTRSDLIVEIQNCKITEYYTKA